MALLRGRKEPEFPAWIRKEEKNWIKPVDVDYPEEADQFFIMACPVVGFDGFILIQWWAADEAGAVTTFGEWLEQPLLALDREFGGVTLGDGSHGPYYHRSGFLLTGFIPFPGWRRRREIA